MLIQHSAFKKLLRKVRVMFLFILLFVFHGNFLHAQSLLDALHQKTQFSKLLKESVKTHENELNQLLASLQKNDPEWVEIKRKELQDHSQSKSVSAISASPEALLNQEMQDYVQTVSRFADEAQKNFSSFATNYGFINNDGSINTQAIASALASIEQDIAAKSSLQPQKKDEIMRQITLHITTIKNAIDSYLKSIKPVKQLVTTPLDQILKKLAAMSSGTQAIEVIAKEQNFANPDGSIKTQAFLDALSKMEKEALEFAGKISAQKKDEVEKIIEPQLAALRKKIEDYKVAHPEQNIPTPAREPAPIASTVQTPTTTQEVAQPPAAPTESTPTAMPETQTLPPSPSLENESLLQQSELPTI